MTCSECNDRLRKQRGCNKPGQRETMQGSPFRFTSPTIYDGDNSEDAIMRECPVGYLLREAPYVYDVMDAASLLENCTPTERGRMSQYWHRAARLVSSERARLRDLDREKEKAKRDATYGARRLRGR